MVNMMKMVKIYVSKHNKEMDMVFNKNVERKQIEEFEKDILEKVTVSPRFVFLKNELIRKNLIYKIEVFHSESDLKKYHSELSISIFNEYGENVCEYDEPNCSLMLCETICFLHNGHIIGVNLLTDKDFLESLELLINKVGKYA